MGRDVKTMIDAAVVTFALLALCYSVFGAWSSMYDDDGLLKFVICMLFALLFAGVAYGFLVKA